MKIICYTTEENIGVVFHEALALKERGHEVEVTTLFPVEDKVHQLFESCGIEFEYCDIISTGDNKAMLIASKMDGADIAFINGSSRGINKHYDLFVSLAVRDKVLMNTIIDHNHLDELFGGANHYIVYDGKNEQVDFTNLYFYIRSVVNVLALELNKLDEVTEINKSIIPVNVISMFGEDEQLDSTEETLTFATQNFMHKLIVHADDYEDSRFAIYYTGGKELQTKKKLNLTSSELHLALTETMVQLGINYIPNELDILLQSTPIPRNLLLNAVIAEYRNNEFMGVKVKDI